jgi:hypothetical protein
MRLYAPNRRAVSTVADVLMVVVVIAAFSILVATALLFRPFALTTGPGNPVTGSGRVVTKELQYNDFRVIRVESAFQAGITYSNSYRVSVTIDDNLFDYLQVSKEGDVLTIGLKPSYNFHSLTSKAEISCRIYTNCSWMEQHVARFKDSIPLTSSRFSYQALARQR